MKTTPRLNIKNIASICLCILPFVFSGCGNGVERIDKPTEQQAKTTNTTQAVTNNNSSTKPPPTNAVTSQPQLTIESAKPIIPTSTKDSEIVWRAGFEESNLSEFDKVGGFIKQGSSGRYSFVTSPSYNGNYSIGLTIDTLAPSQTGAHASYLFYWNELPEDAYYYSAWYYIPASVIPGDWWNIMQWKSTYDGNSDNSIAVYVINVRDTKGFLELVLVYMPDQREKIEIYQDILEVPTDTWFHIEAYYKKSKDKTGQVIVWQDGIQIFNITGTPTTLSDYKIYWSVNNYTDSIMPNPFTIYIDDIAISKIRLGQNLSP